MTDDVRPPALRWASTTSPAGDGLCWGEAGDPGAPPLVLLHGWAQSAACWGEAVVAELARHHHVLAPDLRGHGRSADPAAGYDDPAAWAADLDAVLATAGVTAPPVLLGWSYGGVVATDWLRAGGRCAGLVLVGAVTGLGRGRAGGKVGPAMRAAMPDALSADPAVATPALTAFVAGLGAGRGDAADGPRAQALLAASLATPPAVRAALFARECDADDVLAALTAPALVLHGTDDAVVAHAAGAHAAALLPAAATSWWEGGGHAPFLADPARFTADVLAFTALLP